PKVYQLYANTRRLLLEQHPQLAWNFQNSVFSAATFNFGPTMVTLDHTDNQNFPSGMCSITALGNYDPANGGHLVLFDLGLIVQFPPGSTIHFAGGLIRWVDYGFQTEANFKRESPSL
ncbi:uncharacterized protein EDB91DRAFT_1052935, partial [Suillus paluster]|uniref:uncharacterized protein n=1 Tax=Suillus paluster TaxID=48578 RepID=UPI001B88499C